MIRRQAGLGQVPDYAIEAFQHRPRGGQGGIDMDGAQQGGDGVRRILELDVGEAAFLMQAAEHRVAGFQPIQHGKRLVDAAHIAQAGRSGQQQVAIFRMDGQPGGRPIESLVVLPLLLQGLEAGNLRLQRGGGLVHVGHKNLQ